MKLPGGMNLQQMMKHSHKMQSSMANYIDAFRVDSSSGGGIFRVEINGNP